VSPNEPEERPGRIGHPGSEALARRPSRPLVVAALALAAGSATTSPGERDGAWSIAAVTGAGALHAARGLPLPHAVALLALAPAGAWRAQAGALDEDRMAACGATGGAAEAPYAGGLRPVDGTTAFGDERWHLTGDAPAFELRPGLVRAGELAAVSAAARGLHPATGPFTDKRSRRPFVLLPRADEVVRLGPAPDRSPASLRAHTSALERLDAVSPPTSLLGRVTGELEAARARGLERIAAAGRGATGLAAHDAEEEADADGDTTELDGAPYGTVPAGSTPVGGTPAGVQLAHAGLLAALLLGASEDVDYEVGEHFTRTGTRHIISLSGFHFSLIAWLLGRPLALWAQTLLWSIGAALIRLVASRSAPFASAGVARSRVSHHVRSAARALTSQSVLLALGALAFLPVAGSAAPAARAAVALALASLADLIGRGAARGRRPDGVTLWSTALLLEVLARPAAPLAVSVQLSYGATLALIVVFRPTLTLLRALLPGGGRIAPVDRRGRRRAALWRVPAERSLGAVLGALAAGVVATLATLPITWARFGEWSPIGVVATALVMPFVTAALAGGYAWLLAPDLAPLALPAWSLELLVQTLAWCDTLPTTPLVLPVVSTDRLVLSVTAALAALVYAGRRPEVDSPTSAARGGTGSVGGAAGSAGGAAAAPPSRLRLLALAAAAALVLAPMRRTADAPRGLELVGCDVGRGRAFLLRAPDLGVWLIDGGSSERAGVARRALLPTLRAWGAQEVGVVLTSSDRAHGSALPWLVERFDVHTWVGAAPESVGVSARRNSERLRVDVDEGAVHVRLAETTCVLTLVRTGGAARALVLRAGLDTLWILGAGPEAAVDELLARGLLTAEGPTGARGAHDPHAVGGQRVLVWPSLGVGRGAGALLDALQPRVVWLTPPVPDGVRAELARRGVVSASLATSGGLLLGLEVPP
jgi:ComEC/Rec2-related protein